MRRPGEPAARRAGGGQERRCRRHRRRDDSARGALDARRRRRVRLEATRSRTALRDAAARGVRGSGSAVRYGKRRRASRPPRRASRRRIGNGSGNAPASCAIAPWRASSSRICSTIARLFASFAGKRSMCAVRCSSTWRSVSTTKPRFARSPGDACGDADRERARVPQRIQERGPRVELGEPRLRPREMVLFLARRVRVARPNVRVARNERLRGVERLRAHFSRVIDAHQSGGVPPLVRLEHGFGQSLAGRRTRGSHRARQRAKGAIETDDEGVEGHGSGARIADRGFRIEVRHAIGSRVAAARPPPAPSRISDARKRHGRPKAPALRGDDCLEQVHHAHHETLAACRRYAIGYGLMLNVYDALLSLSILT